MKIINDWPSLNKLNIPTADQPVLANGDSFPFYLPELDKFYVPIMLFYYRLTLLAEDNFYEDS